MFKVWNISIRAPILLTGSETTKHDELWWWWKPNNTAPYLQFEQTVYSWKLDHLIVAVGTSTAESASGSGSDMKTERASYSTPRMLCIITHPAGRLSCVCVAVTSKAEKNRLKSFRFVLAQPVSGSMVILAMIRADKRMRPISDTLIFSQGRP
jgi:hypothetical protein